MRDPKQPEDQRYGGAPEEGADLSRLGEGELEVEEKRDELRRSRQGAAERKQRSRIENGIQIALVAVLLIAAIGSLATLVVGLAGGDAKLAGGGLFALCGIVGGSVYHRLKGGDEEP
jgi:hypothetical protein